MRDQKGETMRTIVWKIPSENMYCRLDELYEYLDHFPNSKLAPAVRTEIAYLESLA